MKKMIRTYDGGGNLGIGPATFMDLAKSHMGFALPQADAVGGTSVGSILAAGEAMGMSFSSIKTVFENCCPTIWREPSIGWRLNPCKPTYDGTGLEDALYTIFRDIRMCDLRIPLFVTAMNYNRGTIKVWDHTDGNLVRDVVRISCSAPTYFPPVSGFVDGGLVANNPSMCTITGVLSKIGWHIDDLWLLSMGTNGDYWRNPNIDSNTSKLAWGKLLLETLTRGNEALATFQSKALLNQRMLRIEPILSQDYALDDLGILDEYSHLWGGLWTMQEELFMEWHKLFRKAK